MNVEASASAKGDALQKLDASGADPCIIVLDLMMPVMDSHAFRLEQLKHADGAKVACVVISAYDEAPERLQEIKATAYLRKPLNLKEFLRVVKSHCADASGGQ